MAERKRIAILVLAAALAACHDSSESAKKFHATDISSVDWARGFELTDHTGRQRTLADFRGKVVLVFFGFTNCPDACPTAMAEMAQVVDRLGPELAAPDNSVPAHRHDSLPGGQQKPLKRAD